MFWWIWSYLCEVSSAQGSGMFDVCTKRWKGKRRGLPEGHYPMKPLSVRGDDVLSPLSLWGEVGFFGG